MHINNLNKILYINILLICAILCTFIILNATSTKYLVIPYIISLLLIFIYVVDNVIFLSTTFFFIMFYVMLFYIQPIYSYTIKNFLAYPIEVHRIYAGITINGIILFIIGNLIVKKSKNKFKPSRMQIINLKYVNYFKLILFILIFTVIVLIVASKGVSLFIYGSRVGLKQEMGYVGLLINYLGYVFSILVFLTFFSIKKTKSKLSICMWLLFLSLIEAFYIFAFRLRSFLVGHFLSAFMGLYFGDFFITVEDRNGECCKSDGIKLWFKKLNALIWLGGILILGTTFRFLRGYLEPGQSISNFSFNLNNFIELSIASGDLGYAKLVMSLINIVPSVHNYLMGQSYYRILFIMIPRFIWKNKPLNTQRIVASWLKPEVIGLTLPPGINGDFYINFGVSGVLVMMLFGIFFAKLN